MSEEMIEKVARAIYTAAQAEALKRGCDVTLPTYDTDDDDARSACLALARAAIAAYNPNERLREALEEAVRDALAKAFAAGALAVHDNWHEDREPDFAEAASDYASDCVASVIDSALSPLPQGED